jgi:hypothetical protein
MEINYGAAILDSAPFGGFVSDNKKWDEKTIAVTKEVLKESFFVLEDLFHYMRRLMDGCEVDDNKIYNAIERAEVVLNVLAKDQLYYDWSHERDE